MDTLIFSASFAAIALLAFAMAKPFDRRLAWGFGLLCAAYLGLDDLATSLPKLSPMLDVLGGEWNWSGKAYSLLLSVTVILALRMTPEAIGLTLKQRNMRSCLIALCLLTSMSFSLGLIFDPGLPSAETLAFQALMPALAEETAYRGIAPALLLGLIHGRRDVPENTPWAVVAIVSVMFGLWHGLGYADGAFSFETVPALYTFIGSFACGWLRFRSGSLLFPLLAHALGNTVFQLTAFL